MSSLQDKPPWCERCEATGLVPLIEERAGMKYEVSYRCSCGWSERRWMKMPDRDRGGVYAVPRFDDQAGVNGTERRIEMYEGNLSAWHTPDEITGFKDAGRALLKKILPVALQPKDETKDIPKPQVEKETQRDDGERLPF